MVQGGLTPIEGIVAATRGSAGALGRDDLGTVAAGAVADLLVVDGDPLADIRLLNDPERIWLVLAGGRVVGGRGAADRGQNASSAPGPAMA
jgi:imidazolonepropionase-like amidohydrolase